ncbi:MAG: hypothetical protein IKJ63_10950 [Clostridia bacterium]|nr:hypothetical protein [Clostridia bacterium]
MPFKTTVSAKKNIATAVSTTVCLFGLGFGGLKISVKAWLFFELILLITGFICIFLTAKNRRTIEYQCKQFKIYNNLSKQVFVCMLNEVDIVQTEKQKQTDCCNIKMKNNPMIHFSDVNNYTGLQAAIQADLQENQ